MKSLKNSLMTSSQLIFQHNVNLTSIFIVENFSKILRIPHIIGFLFLIF